MPIICIYVKIYNELVCVGVNVITKSDYHGIKYGYNKENGHYACEKQSSNKR